MQPPWQVLADPKSGRTYYYNQETSETVWRRPAHLDGQAPGDISTASKKLWKAAKHAASEKASKQSASNSAVPVGATGAGWMACLDEKTGKTYFWHRQSNKTVWKVPGEMAAALALTSGIIITDDDGAQYK